MGTTSQRFIQLAQPSVLVTWLVVECWFGLPVGWVGKLSRA
jgi:hypothetical protein